MRTTTAFAMGNLATSHVFLFEQVKVNVIAFYIHYFFHLTRYTPDDTLASS